MKMINQIDYFQTYTNVHNKTKLKQNTIVREYYYNLVVPTIEVMFSYVRITCTNLYIIY